MSNFMEKIKKEREALIKKTFSMSLFLELMKDYLNEPEFKSHMMKVESGKAVKITKYPVKEFRQIIYNILTDYGVDKNEAATILTKYKFKSKDLEGMYTFMTDFIYYYLQTGRNFKLFDKEDISANIYLKEKDEVIKTTTSKKDGSTKNIKLKKHYKLGQKSTCSKWNREEILDDGKVRAIMEQVVREL